MNRGTTILTILLSVAMAVGWAQSVQSLGDESGQTEISSMDAAIKVRVNLVLVKAVVWDGKGKAVPNLKQADFQIFDNGKRQKISSFSVETAEAPATSAAQIPRTKADEDTKNEPENRSNAQTMPQRFLALVFDDLHMTAADAMSVRAATQKLFASLTPTDRVAIYSTHGDIKQDFTADPAILRKTLAAVTPHPVKGESQYECPRMSYYQADLIANKHDQEAITVAEVDAENNGCTIDIKAMAERIVRAGDSISHEAYDYLGEIVKQLETMPGQRVLVYVSPGFIGTDSVLSNGAMWIQHAVRGGVVVNTIEARGLYTAAEVPEIDAPPQAAPYKSASMDYQAKEGTYRMQAQFESGQVLAGIAASTGGRYFHNRSDLNVAMNQALGAPEVSYILGFRPEQPVQDGKFHNLKVRLAKGRKYEIQATNGYYASRKPANNEEDAGSQVREALNSREEMAGIPVQIKTEFTRTNAAEAQIAVITHVDVAGLRFRKAEERNCNDLVLAAALFDTNGRLVDGQIKDIALRLQDSTLQSLRQTGLTFNMVFTAKPGTYRVRAVLRGSEADPLTARNLTTSIPLAQAEQHAKKTPFQDLHWAPPNVNARLTSPLPSPTCNLEEVLVHAAANALDLATNLEKFTAQERIDYATIDRSGIVEDYDSGLFQYVYSIEQQRGGGVSREYRNPKRGSHMFRAAGQHIGGVAIALMFLPDLQSDYEMKCEGAEDKNGTPTWVLDFRQRQSRPSRTAKIWVHDVARPARFRGRAWIAQDNFQIVHLEVDLLEGVPEIGLQRLAATVDYRPVQSSSGQPVMWLPSRVDSYWDYDVHRVMLAHTYSDFEFFTVETKEKVQ